MKSNSKEYEAAAVRSLEIATEKKGEPVISQIAGAAVCALLAVAAAIRESGAPFVPDE